MSDNTNIAQVVETEYDAQLDFVRGCLILNGSEIDLRNGSPYRNEIDRFMGDFVGGGGKLYTSVETYVKFERLAHVMGALNGFEYADYWYKLGKKTYARGWLGFARDHAEQAGGDVLHKVLDGISEMKKQYDDRMPIWLRSNVCHCPPYCAHL